MGPCLVPSVQTAHKHDGISQDAHVDQAVPVPEQKQVQVPTLHAVQSHEVPVQGQVQGPMVQTMQKQVEAPQANCENLAFHVPSKVASETGLTVEEVASFNERLNAMAAAQGVAPHVLSQTVGCLLTDR